MSKDERQKPGQAAKDSAAKPSGALSPSAAGALNMQEQLESIIRNIPGGLAVFRIIDGEVYRSYLSEGAFQVLGYAKNERPADNIAFTLNRVHPDDQPGLRAAIREATLNRQTFNLDMRIIPRPGELRWVNLVANPVVMDDGTLQFFGIYSDVTARHEAEEREREARRKRDMIFENAPGGLLRWNLAGSPRIDFVGDGYCRMTGYTREEMRALVKETGSPIPLIPETDRETVFGIVEKLRHAPQTLTFDCRYFHRDGSVRYSRDTMRSVRDADGVMRIYEQVFDVTEQRRAEEDLHISEAEYLAAIAQSSRVISRYTLHDASLTFSEADARRLGLPPVVKNAPEALPEGGMVAPESAEAWRNMFTAIRRGEPSGSAVIRLQLGRDESLWYRAFFTSIRNISGETVSAIIAWEDITQERESLKNRAFERVGLFRALCSVYPMSIACNLSQNSYYMLEYERFINHTAAEQGSFDDLIRAGLSTLPEEDRGPFEDAFSRQSLLRAFAEGRDVIRLEHRQFDNDGVLHWMETIVFHVVDPYDNDALGIAIARCIDEQKHGEEQLRQALDITSGRLSETLRFNELIDASAPFLILAHYQDADVPPFLLGNLPRMLGYTVEEVGRSILQGANSIVHPEDREALLEQRRKVFADQPPEYDFIYRIRKKDGAVVWISVHGARFEDETRGPGYVCIYLDSTERQRLINELSTSRESYRMAIESSDRLIYNYSIPERAAYLPDRMRRLLGQPQIVENVPESVIALGSVSADSLPVYRSFYESIQEGLPCAQDYLFERRIFGGEKRWFKVRYVLVNGPGGKPVSAIIYMDDVTESKKKEELLLDRAERDGLTGLYNREAVETYIRERLSAGGPPCVLLMLDMDALKDVNDSFGHAQGDRALRIIADELRQHFRSSDIVGRLGGDEFIVYLSGVTSESAIGASLSSLLRRLSTITIGENGEQAIHCSIGATMGRPGLDDFDTLYRQADVALYHVKRNGKNDYIFYTPQMQDADYAYPGRTNPAAERDPLLDEKDMPALIEAIAGYYPLVLSVNLSRNRYTLLRASEFVTSLVPSSGSYDDFLSATSGTYWPEDCEKVLSCMSREALLQAYESGQASARCYARQINRAGSAYHWIEITSLFYKQESGDVCEFAFARPAPEKGPEEPRL
ncbi:MAG: PAS domain-containing protein [Clostridia bacterium]|nr:PAS domain-containing protein [Clostridia bacterium]